MAPGTESSGLAEVPVATVIESPAGRTLRGSILTSERLVLSDPGTPILWRGNSAERSIRVDPPVTGVIVEAGRIRIVDRVNDRHRSA